MRVTYSAESLILAQKGEKRKEIFLTGLGVYVKENIVNTLCTLQT